MNIVMVQYRVKADRAEENRGYIEKVFQELASSQPKGLKYASFVQEDGVSFVHVSMVDGENPLQQTPAFKAFVADIQSRCEVPPVARKLTPVGDFHVVGA
jgi:hypothetical protein